MRGPSVANDQATPSPRKHPPEIYETREVSRQVDVQHHQHGLNVANFMGDVEDMLMDGVFYGLSPRDLRALAHFHRAAIRSADNDEGGVVSLSGRQWGAFVGIRRTYLTARRNPANLTAMLRAKRATS